MSSTFSSPNPQCSRKRRYSDLVSYYQEIQAQQQPIIDWLSNIIVPHCHSTLGSCSSEILYSSQQSPAGDLPITPMFELPTSQPSTPGGTSASIAKSLATAPTSRTPIPRPVTPSGKSASAVRVKTDADIYPSILYGNGLMIDKSGNLIPKEIEQFLAGHILKNGETRLDTADIERTKEIADSIVDCSESVINELLDTPMFLIMRRGVYRGGNTQWTRGPLPRTSFDQELITPKPDFHYGYPLGKNSRFSLEQSNVILHPFALEYAIPTSDNVLLFLIVEIKSEAKGGTLWHAQNQAAGGGAHSVNCLRWLHGQARIPTTSVNTCCFSICITTFQVCLYVHYYSTKDKKFIMSCIRVYNPCQTEDIQYCNWHVSDIVEYALTIRRIGLERCLDSLYPFPQDWPS